MKVPFDISKVDKRLESPKSITVEPVFFEKIDSVIRVMQILAPLAAVIIYIPAASPLFYLKVDSYMSRIPYMNAR